MMTETFLLEIGARLQQQQLPELDDLSVKNRLAGLKQTAPHGDKRIRISNEHFSEISDGQGHAYDLVSDCCRGAALDKGICLFDLVRNNKPK
jgi:hypothetical protein